MLLTANWSEAWLMTGIGVGVVFIILIILVLVLCIFSFVAQKSAKDNGAKGNVATQPAVKAVSEASDLDKAAVATALYLYQKSKGDQESGVLTINKTPSAWHAVLNERL